MVCKHCLKELSSGMSFSHSWKKIRKVCTKLTLCKECAGGYEDCLPTEKEKKAFFGLPTKRQKRKKNRSKK